tara:strand:- start:10830 stop:11972 length:1143 start_codon:yes stop_codon:yes gene_type:complete
VADITVQVSSAGLSAYGASTWSSNTYGGDNVSSTIVGSAEAFNNEGWGRLSWNSLAWGQDFENQTVQVSTPGNPTTWGSDVWGDAGWGQITGLDVDQGNSELTVSVDVSITGQELTGNTGTAVAGASAEVSPTGAEATSTDGNVFGGEVVEVQVTSPVNDEWGTEFWGAGQWGVGDGVTILLGQEVISGDANIVLEGVSSNTFSGTAEIPVVIDTGIGLSLTQGDAFGGELVEVQVTTASTQPWGETAWGDGQWGQSVGTDISQGGEEVAVPSVEVDVTGISISSNTGDESITGDSNLTLTGIALDIQQGDEDAFTNVRVSVSGNDIGTIVIGNFLAGTSAEAQPSGVTATTTTGIIGLNAWAVVDPDGDTTWTVVDLAA